MEKELKRRENGSYWVGKNLLEYLLEDQSRNNLI